MVGGECGIAGSELSGCCGCGCEVVEPQPAELLIEAIEGNEDLVLIPLDPDKLVEAAEVEIDREVDAGPLGGIEVLEARVNHQYIPAQKRRLRRTIFKQGFIVIIITQETRARRNFHIPGRCLTRQLPTNFSSKPGKIGKRIVVQ